MAGGIELAGAASLELKRLGGPRRCLILLFSLVQLLKALALVQGLMKDMTKSPGSDEVVGPASL